MIDIDEIKVRRAGDRDIAALLAHIATLAHAAAVQAQRAEAAEAKVARLRASESDAEREACAQIADRAAATLRGLRYPTYYSGIDLEPDIATLMSVARQIRERKARIYES